MNYYMGIDIGTSGCKAVLFDENGNQRKSAYREYNIISAQPGRAELDSDEVINKCFEVIREAASFVPEGSVKGIGISSQGEAFTLIDEKGKALTNAFVSSDIRAVQYVKKWPKAFGEDRLYRITGHTPHPMFSLFKLLWIRDNMPEKWGITYKILCFEDLLQYRLGITDPAIGWSLAGRTMLFDVVNHCWDKDILESLAIKEIQLSRPLPSGIVAGFMSNKIARSLNLDGSIPIVTGGHDQPCSALGAGALESGVAVYASGTVDCITPAFKTPIFSPLLKKNNLCTYDHAAPGMYATIAFSLTGGNILKWFRNEFGKEETEDSVRLNCSPYDLLLKKMPENPANLLVLPYFTPSGTPYFDTKTKGAIIGLDLSTTKAEIMKALLEGVALEMRLNLDILEQSGYRINELRAIGGGARSKAWIQLRADIVQKPITISGTTEAGCMGVAMLAASAVKNLDVFSMADKWIKHGAVIQPRSGKVYDNKFLSYRKLYKKVSSITLPSMEYFSKREL
jgi:xylulokinase